MDEVKITKKFLKSNELKENQTRQAQYFNSEWMMISDQGKWQALNAKILNQGKILHTGVFRTHRVLMLAYYFCKHPNYDQLENAFWSLINPEQTRYVPFDQVINFLKDVQVLAIDIPMKIEDESASSDNAIIHYFRNISSIKDKAILMTVNRIKENPKPQVIMNRQN